MTDFPVFNKNEWSLMIRCADMLLDHVNESKRCKNIAMELYGFMRDLIKEEANNL